MNVRQKMRTYLKPIVGLIITAVFVTLLAGQINRADVLDAVRHVSLGAVALAVSLLAVGYSLRILRWWWMLRSFDASITYANCCWPFLVSIALNNVLPLRAGDAARVVGFRDHVQAPRARLLGTMVIERLLDVVVLLALFFLGVRGLDVERVPAAFVRAAMLAAALAVGGTTALLLFHRVIATWLARVAEHPRVKSTGAGRAVTHLGAHLLEALAMLRTPRLALALLAVSAVAWLCEGGVYLAIVRSLAVDPPPAAAWFALATGTLATILPSSPGYIGTFDFFAVIGLTAYGVPRDQAVACALVIHLVLWLPLTVAGLSYFLRPGRRSLPAVEPLPSFEERS